MTVAALSSAFAAPAAPPVLVLAPNPVHRLVLKAAMETAGYRADTARDCDHAIERVRAAMNDNGLYMLVLMDTELPLGDRLDFAGRVRDLGADTERLPLVALTGDPGEDAQPRALTTADLKQLAERLSRLSPVGRHVGREPLGRRLVDLESRMERLAEAPPCGIDAVLAAENLADSMHALEREAHSGGLADLATAAARFEDDFRSVRDGRRLAVLVRAARALLVRFRNRGKKWPASSLPTTIPSAANSLPA